MNSRDKIKILFPNPEDVLKMFHINFETGKIYKKDFWDRDIPKEVGRAYGKEYRRINVNCPNLTHIFKRGYTDVSAHRLIYYAHTGELPEKVDHMDKNIEYPDSISNLTTSDSIHNRWNTKKVKRKRLSPEERVDNSPSSYKQRNVEEYRGIYIAYGYYWAKFDGLILNENGFISPILAVNCRNKHLKKEFIKRYGSLNNFPKNALDIIDKNELFLEQMSQEAIEKTPEYQEKQRSIKEQMKKRSEIKSKQKLNKEKISVKEELDAFDWLN